MNSIWPKHGLRGSEQLYTSQFNLLLLLLAVCQFHVHCHFCNLTTAATETRFINYKTLITFFAVLTKVDLLMLNHYLNVTITIVILPYCNFHILFSKIFFSSIVIQKQAAKPACNIGQKGDLMMILINGHQTLITVQIKCVLPVNYSISFYSI